MPIKKDLSLEIKREVIEAIEKAEAEGLIFFDENEEAELLGVGRMKDKFLETRNPVAIFQGVKTHNYYYIYLHHFPDIDITKIE